VSSPTLPLLFSHNASGGSSLFLAPPSSGQARTFGHPALPRSVSSQGDSRRPYASCEFGSRKQNSPPDPPTPNFWQPPTIKFLRGPPGRSRTRVSVFPCLPIRFWFLSRAPSLFRRRRRPPFKDYALCRRARISLYPITFKLEIPP